MFKPGKGTRNCNCKTRMTTKQIAPGMYQQIPVQSCDQCQALVLGREKESLSVEIERGMKDGQEIVFFEQVRTILPGRAVSHSHAAGWAALRCFEAANTQPAAEALRQPSLPERTTIAASALRRLLPLSAPPSDSLLPLPFPTLNPTTNTRASRSSMGSRGTSSSGS